MREQIDTIPVNDAFASGDECPFCYLERKAEQSTVRYVAGPGASYMEPEVREVTDRLGFCTHHTKTLYDYGNTLGNALMLQTYYAWILKDFMNEAEAPDIPEKKSLFSGKKPQTVKDAYWQRLQKKVDSCFICERVDYHMERYYDTFFTMLKDEAFRKSVEQSKGFCIRHFAGLLQQAEGKLPSKCRDWFYPAVYGVMQENLVRVKEDLDWLVAKYDYRNAKADWKNSRDALQRAMQKMQGLHPADPPYKNE